eukprot:678467-Pleurochrysis_carterae.AAC.6
MPRSNLSNRQPTRAEHVPNRLSAPEAYAHLTKTLARSTSKCTQRDDATPTPLNARRTSASLTNRARGTYRARTDWQIDGKSIRGAVADGAVPTKLDETAEVVGDNTADDENAADAADAARVSSALSSARVLRAVIARVFRAADDAVRSPQLFEVQVAYNLAHKVGQHQRRTQPPTELEHTDQLDDVIVGTSIRREGQVGTIFTA